MKRTSATGNEPGGRAAAFTLIELSIVVFIMAVLLVAAAPSFVRSYNSAQLGAAGRDLATTCLLARYHAALQQKPVTLNVDIDRQVSSVSAAPGAEAEEGGGGGTLKISAVPSRIRLVSVTAADGTVYDHGQVGIRFYANGTCDGFSVIFVGVDKREAMTVRVDPVTGRAAADEAR